MKKFAFATLVLTIGGVIIGCSNPSTGVNEPAGGGTLISDSGRTLKLNYDIRKALDSAESIDWGCDCEVVEEFTIDGDRYMIFGDCGSHNGKQLVRRGKDYYLIPEKLRIKTIDSKKAVHAPKSKSE